MSAERVCLQELLARFSWLTERRVRSMVAEKAVQHWKVRGRLLFDPQDFQDLLNAGYVAPGPPAVNARRPPGDSRGASPAS